MNTGVAIRKQGEVITMKNKEIDDLRKKKSVYKNSVQMLNTDKKKTDTDIINYKRDLLRE